MLRGALPTACLLGVLALATGCAGATTTASTIPDSASLAPADALVFATMTTDESSDRWKQAASLLERIPGASGGLRSSLGPALREQGLDWTDDVRPALGPELVVVATSDEQPIVLLQPEDEAKLDALLAKSDTKVARGTVDGWQALARSQTALDGYRTALAKGTLAGDDAFTEGFETLPPDALARLWADTASLSKALPLVEQGSSAADLGFDWFAAALSAEDDGVLLTLAARTPGSGDTRYEPVLFRRVPADAVAALSFGGTLGLLDRVQGAVPLDRVSGEIEKLTGVSLQSLVDTLSGEGVLYVRPSGTRLPEVTLALRPPDPAKTWEIIERLGRRLAEQAKTTITVQTENGVEVRQVVTDQATVSYARLADDRVVVTTGTEGIRTFLADGPKLVDSAAYERAAGSVDLGERTRGFLYVDIDGVLPLAERAGAAVPAEAKDVLSALHSLILQSTGNGDVTTLSGFLRLDD